MLNIPRTTSTQEIAQVFGVKASTISQTLSRFGHFHGLRPVVRIGKRPLWLAEDIERLFQRNEPQASERKAA